MEQAEVPLPPGFWISPAVAAALASCDIATLLEEIRRANGWTQKRLALAVGYSQSWVSNVLRGQQELTVGQVREISRRVGVPIHALRFGDAGGVEPTKRREFGQVMTLALIPLPARTVVDETTARTPMAITGAQRRLDATTCARDLARGATARLEMANRLLRRAQGTPFAAELATAASEAAGLAAWLCADMCDLGSARVYYRAAISYADRSSHDLLVGYMLGSLGAFETATGDPERGLALLARARQRMGGIPCWGSRAWLDANEAVCLAAAGRSSGAAALARAAQALERDGGSEPPRWPWVFPFDQAKLAGYRALAAVRLTQPAAALAAFTEAGSGAQPAPKQRAMVMLGVATAISQDGVRRHDNERVGEAFRLAGNALAIGVSYSSERVIERARRFRRDYSGPPSSYARDLDDQLGIASR